MSYYQPQFGYQNMYGSFYNPYQQLQQQQMPQAQQYSPVQQETLNGQIVDSIDVVRSKNCNLDGTPTYYPKADKTEVYCKQLNPQTGAGVILTYKLVDNSSIPQNNSDGEITNMITQLQSDVNELKTMLMDSLTTPYSFDKKGGGK